MRKTSGIVLLILLFLLPGGQARCRGAEAGFGRVGIVISRNIRPYLAARDRAVKVFNRVAGLKIDHFSLPDFAASQRPALLADMGSRPYRFLLAIGPEAAHFLAGSPVPLPPVVHTMMLNPEKLIGPEACGVFMNIPIAVQLGEIARRLPSVSKIAVLYDPENNSAFVEEAAREAERLGREIVPLAVGSRGELAAVLADHWGEFGAVWFIPDRTVISESIVAFIIKEAFIKKVPTIGYNRFFADSGSLLAFVLDYAGLGGQAAELALDFAATGVCRRQPPRFRVRVNHDVASRLGIALDGAASAGGGRP